MGHDQNAHAGLDWALLHISETLYIRKLRNHLRAYISQCPECQLNQTRCHSPYGSLNPISTPDIPFHTIAMNFIVALPVEGPELYNALLTVSCKFSKAKIFIPGRDDYSAADWAILLLTYLRLCNWGIPRATISDRDAKFRSELWKTLFHALGTKLLTSTAYHPQTDGLSERTNQNVEIALRFLITSGVSWPKALPALQSAFMNTSSAVTGASPNQILYGFNTRDRIGLLNLTTVKTQPEID